MAETPGSQRPKPRFPQCKQGQYWPHVEVRETKGARKEAEAMKG